jgi:hypothetical protein
MHRVITEQEQHMTDDDMTPEQWAALGADLADLERTDPDVAAAAADLADAAERFTGNRYPTVAEVAVALTGEELDPHPAVDYCSVCGQRRDGPGWAGCKAHTRSTTEGEQP